MQYRGITKIQVLVVTVVIVVVIALLTTFVIIPMLAPPERKIRFAIYTNNPNDDLFKWATWASEEYARRTGIKVELIPYPHEEFKVKVRALLISEEPPDIFTWFTGTRLYDPFVKEGLIMDVTDVWQKNNLYNQFYESGIATVTFNGKQYGITWSTYTWGIVYNKKVFKNLGISPPTTWSELIDACKKLSAAGIVPIAIGNRYKWPAAGWFDIMNLRTNGLDYHMRLMKGEVPYTDAGVRRAFEKWKEIVPFFMKEHAAYDWMEPVPMLIDGRAGMYYLGAFIFFQIPEDKWEDFGFLQFPKIDPSIDYYEDMPTDGIMIPAKAKNAGLAKEFMAFLASREAQQKFADIASTLTFHKEVTYSKTIQLTQLDILRRAKGVAQFYDRDTPPAMYEKAMDYFVQFIDNPDKIDEILASLESLRKEAFK